MKHYINNKFLQLDQARLRQQEETELGLFKNVHFARNTNKQQSAVNSNSQFASKFGKQSSTSSESYMNYLQNKLDEGLAIKSTNEEEKYVYLLKRMSEFLNTDLLLNEFLNCLKVMLLCGDFNDWYQMRMARMICFVCKATLNQAFLRCFIYDMLMLHFSTATLKFGSFHSLIVLFVRIWPELLNWPSNALFNEADSFEATIKKNPVLCVVIFIVKKAIDESRVGGQEAVSRTVYDLQAYHIYVSTLL
jgi:hypothetical protein